MKTKKANIYEREARHGSVDLMWKYFSSFQINISSLLGSWGFGKLTFKETLKLLILEQKEDSTSDT